VWSNLFAQSAEQIALAAAPIVAVIFLDPNVAETGILQTTLTLPFLLVATSLNEGALDRPNLCQTTSGSVRRSLIRHFRLSSELA